MSDQTPRSETPNVEPAGEPATQGAAVPEGTESSSLPRRSKPKNSPPPPSGYRSTRRGSKSAKAAKRAETVARVSEPVGRGAKFIKDLGYYLFVALVAVLGLVLVLLVLAYGINGFARWNARRIAEKAGTLADLERRSKENVLVIGVKDGEATGFLALRVDRKDNQTYGIAIPDGAFLEVPGQGFERVGESYHSGPLVSLSAISNFLTVPFHTFIVVPSEIYSQVLTSQSAGSVLTSVTATNLSPSARDALKSDIAAIPQKNTAIVPMPVKPIKLGNQTYFEPQRQQIADLLKQWWGVDASKEAQVTRVILYNGNGTPGIAGVAAQELIRAGYRVVDTKNADNFNYPATQIVVQRGPVKQGTDIEKVLGVGVVKNQPSDQNVADVIVIVGKDFKPPAGGATGGTQ